VRFPMKFSRWVAPVPPGQIALGADVVPVGQHPSSNTMGNLMVSRFANINGWPCHRVAVTYKGPIGAPALPATLWFWEELTQHWYQIGATVNLALDKVTFFDVVGLLDGPNSQGEILNPTAGSIAVLLLVTDPGGTPAGEYTLAMAPDLTTF